MTENLIFTTNLFAKRYYQNPHLHFQDEKTDLDS